MRVWLLVAAALVIIVVVIAWPRIDRFLKLDDCLDAGGGWDEARNACVYARQPAPPSRG